MLHRLSLKRVESLLMALGAMVGMLALAPSLARAQNTNSGTVIGQITDAQGAAMVGAVVTLTNTATNDTQATIANNTGRYTFVNLNPGTYTLAVKKEGFKEATVKNQPVTVGKTVTLNVPMQVGTATQTVEVTASGAELQTMNAVVGSSVSADAIIKLPNLNRDANSLTMLQPNTQPDGGVGGADSDQNSFTLDGGSSSNDMDGNNADYTPTSGGATSGVIPTPADSIEQFTVSVANQTADVNAAAGSTVAMVTKRGTDAVHGSAYEYYLGSYLSANDWGNNQQNVARPKSHQNRFGASLGGEILPKFLGGKTYLFGNYEGRRFPNAAVIDRNVPTALFRAGVIQADNVDSDGNGPGWEAYNINPTTVTVGGTAYQPAVCNQPGGGTGACDPRGIGMNAVVSALWSKYEPLPNQTNGGDKHNTLNYQGNVNESLKSNFFVGRLDHDFGAKNHFTATYHFYSYNPFTTSQVDYGGAIAGDTFGQFVPQTQRPQLPSMATAQLTSSITANFTNRFQYSYLRNFWQWGGADLSPQVVPGFGALGGALEIGGESANALIPYNVNTQSVRSRFWDGIGNTLSDDMTLLHGNHIFQFGGKYTHQWDYHQRNDNGGGIMAADVYQIGSGGGVANSYTPADFISGASTASYKNVYAEALGIVDQPQTLYTRSGPQLNLQPLGSSMFDQSNIPLYNVYATDSWHIKPNVTLTYGAGYTVEMPPLEAQGKQVELVDGAGNLVGTSDYLAATERAALGGQVYNPELGFATVANVGGGLKYPYKPFYGGLSPRISVAWNPSNTGIGGWLGGSKAVIRGGWSRIYGRLNGVDLVLVPLLGTGLGQAVSCIGASSTGQCLGTSGVDPTTAFRIGTDGLTAPLGAAPTATLPQPFYPGEVQNGVVNTSSGSGEVLDPNFKPNRSDEFDLTYQRQFSSNFSTELGYTGRVIRNEYQAINMDAVPYMFTAGGQQFQKAFANLWQQMAAGSTITPQSFFETALGGAGSSFCKTATSCTAAVAAAYGPSGQDYIDPGSGNDVTSLWTALNNQSSWTLGRTIPSLATTCSTPGVGGCPANGIASPNGQLSAIYENASLGFGNYNSLFWTVTMRNFHHLTATSNFTWSRSMGTGQVDQATSEFTVADPWNIHAMYGPQYNDSPLYYNAYFVYEPGSQTQHGILGHLANGWSFAPVITWRITGFNPAAGNAGWTPVVQGGQCSSFGETDCSTGSTVEDAVMTSAYTGGRGYLTGQNPQGVGSDSDPSNGGTGMNRFADPAKVLAQFRPLVLGLDTTSQSGHIPGLSVTNVDFAITKDLAISERFGAELSAQATNVFNHFAPTEEGDDITNPASFGVISGNALGARTVEVGLRLHW